MGKKHNSVELSNSLFLAQTANPNFKKLDKLTQSIILSDIENSDKRIGEADSSRITICNYPAINIKTIKNLININGFSMSKCQILNFKYHDLEELCELIINHLQSSHHPLFDTYHEEFFELNYFVDFNMNNKRLYDYDFWLKKLRSLWITQKEESLRKTNKVRKYISNFNSVVFDSRKKEQLKTLENKFMVNKLTGELFSMKDLALKSESNQMNELLFKNFVIEQEARKKDFEFLFITPTLPSIYHAKKKLTKTVKQGHDDLNDFFVQFRKNLNHNDLKSGEDFFYLSVNEAHKDGCEHRHIMFFCKRDKFDLIRSIMRTCYFNKFYLSEYKTKCKRIDKAHATVKQKKERKEKAKQKIFDLIDNVAIKYVEEDKEKGGASSYIYKYITKEVGSETESFDDRYNDVKKWARINNIRQYNISGINYNFQAFKLCMRIFCSSNSVENIKYLKELNNDSLEANQLIDSLNDILSTKIVRVSKKDQKSMTTEEYNASLDRQRFFNYNKLIRFNEFVVENNYENSMNRYDEIVKKLNHVEINGVMIKLKNNYEIISI